MKAEGHNSRASLHPRLVENLSKRAHAWAGSPLRQRVSHARAGVCHASPARACRTATGVRGPPDGHPPWQMGETSLRTPPLIAPRSCDRSSGGRTPAPTTTYVAVPPSPARISQMEGKRAIAASMYFAHHLVRFCGWSIATSYVDQSVVGPKWGPTVSGPGGYGIVYRKRRPRQFYRISQKNKRMEETKPRPRRSTEYCIRVA